MKFAYSLNDLICYDENKNFIASLGESSAVIKKIKVLKHFLELEFELDSIFLSRIESLSVIYNGKEIPLNHDQQKYYKVHINRVMNGNDEISIVAYTIHGQVMLPVTDMLRRKKEALIGNFVIYRGAKKILLKKEQSVYQRLKKIMKGFKNN